MSEVLCQHCGGTTKLQLCSRCKLAAYCGIECQRKDWPAHKLICGKSFETEAADIDTHMEFINPRPDRSLKTHGTGTVPIVKISKPLIGFIKALKCDIKNANMMYVDDSFPLGGYGRCWHNVSICIKHTGKGVVAFGWALFENEHMFEAEMHCVVKYKGHYYNVTRSACATTTYSGMFVEDDYVESLALLTEQHPKNRVMWK